MQTYLILSSKKPFISKQIKSFIKISNTSEFDTLDFNSDEKLGIDDVRNLIRESIKKPYAGNSKLTIIRNFSNSTLEAQNSLLKFLEEQPPFLTILLISQNTRNILPTVLSRSQIIKDTSPAETGKLELLQLLKMTLGQRLEFVQKNITDRDKAARFLESLINTSDNLLLSNESQDLISLSRYELSLFITKSEKARGYLELNLNYKHVLDVLLLGFPKIS